MLNFSWYFFTYATLNVGTGGHESTLLYPEINDNGKGNLRSTSVGNSSLTRRSTFERVDMTALSSQKEVTPNFSNLTFPLFRGNFGVLKMMVAKLKFNDPSFPRYLHTKRSNSIDFLQITVTKGSNSCL